MRWRWLIAGLAAVSACSPAPRAASYFIAHPDVAQAVVAGCAAGTHSGPECDNAAVGLARRQSDARLNDYRRGF